MKYNLVFESSNESTIFPYFITIITFIFLIILIKNFRERKLFPHKYYYKVYYRFFIAFIIFIAFLFCFMLYDIRTLYMANTMIENNTYKKVEGIIKNFHPMHKSGHGIEKFDINGVYFEIIYTGNYPSDKSRFYTLTKNRNGPIQRNGQKVKIHYITINGENEIIKMWVYSESTE